MCVKLMVEDIDHNETGLHKIARPPQILHYGTLQ